MAKIELLTIPELRLLRWIVNITQNEDGSFHGIIGTIVEDEQYHFEIDGATAEVVEDALRSYGTAIQNGVELEKWKPEDMFFPKNHLMQWISESQMMQFEGMYDQVVEVAYQNALSMVCGQIAEYFDMDRILARDENVNDMTLKIMEWILEVLTAWNICSAGLNPSPMLQTNYTMVINKLVELKNGTSTMNSAPIKPELNAAPVIFSRSRENIG